jgi:hypothetical protein
VRRQRRFEHFLEPSQADNKMGKPVPDNIRENGDIEFKKLFSNAEYICEKIDIHISSTQQSKRHINCNVSFQQFYKISIFISFSDSLNQIINFNSFFFFNNNSFKRYNWLRH